VLRHLNASMSAKSVSDHNTVSYIPFLSQAEHRPVQLQQQQQQTTLPALPPTTTLAAVAAAAMAPTATQQSQAGHVLV
jgi:hypothetical protein